MIPELKSLITRAMDRAGYTIIPNWRLDRYQLATHLTRLFDLLRVDCVLDVGANRGQFRDFLRQEVGFEGLIVSFEPIPSLAATLETLSRNDPQWLVHATALGAKAGVQKLNVMRDTCFSSFLTPDHSGFDGFERSNAVKEVIDVKVEMLDDVLPNLILERALKRVYLKMDTQGRDLDVLNGAKQSLRSVVGLQTEASVVPLYMDMPHFTAMLETLGELGFDLSMIVPVGDAGFPRLLEFDCVMVNRSVLPFRKL